MRNKDRQKTKRKLRRELSGLLFASPWLIGFIAFSLIPILMSMYHSVCSYNLFTEPVFIGLDNYKNLFSDRLFWKSVYNTLIFTVIFVPFQILLSIGVAALLNFNIKGQWLFRTIFYVPAIIPVVASSVLWRWLFNYQYGLINNILNFFGLPGILWLQDPRWTKPALILMGLWGSGNVFIIFLASMKDIPQMYYDASRIDGANSWQRFKYITLSSITNVIFYQIVMGLIAALQYFTQAYVLMSGYLETTPSGPEDSMLFYGMQIYYKAFYYFDMGSASAMAWMLFVFAAVITLILFKTSAKWVFYGGEGD